MVQQQCSIPETRLQMLNGVSQRGFAASGRRSAFRSESPEYKGRAVMALAADSTLFRKNGQLLWVTDRAEK